MKNLLLATLQAGVACAIASVMVYANAAAEADAPSKAEVQRLVAADALKSGPRFAHEQCTFAAQFPEHFTVNSAGIDGSDHQDAIEMLARFGLVTSTSRPTTANINGQGLPVTDVAYSPSTRAAPFLRQEGDKTRFCFGPGQYADPVVIGYGEKKGESRPGYSLDVTYYLPSPSDPTHAWEKAVIARIQDPAKPVENLDSAVADFDRLIGRHRLYIQGTLRHSGKGWTLTDSHEQAVLD
jgi:hypothetical protein